VSNAGKFPQITFQDAAKLLGEDPSYYSLVDGKYKAISSKGEQDLIQRFNGCVWLTHPIHELVPFYQAFTADRRLAKAADFLIGIGETVGCGQRHAGADSLLEALKLHQVPADEYEWYIRMKREFPMQTAGFGLGIERFLLWILKHNDIRDMAIMSRLKGIRSVP
jgi:asparaginyl-tRNA synthetase